MNFVGGGGGGGEKEEGDEEDDGGLEKEVFESDEGIEKVGTAIVLFIGALVTFFIRIIELVAVIISWFYFLFSISPWIFLGVGLTITMVPYVKYQDVIIEEVDFAFRCYVYPFWQSWPRELGVIIQMLYNPLICFYDATIWLPFGIIQRVIIPLFVQCGFFQTMLALLQFILIFLVDFVIDYVATLSFFVGDFNYRPSGVAWTAFWTRWQDLLVCTCGDLEPFLKGAWIITVFPPIAPIPAELFIGFPLQIIASVPNLINVFYGPILGLIAGNQVGDPQSWCAIWSAFNGLMNVFQQIWRILAAILTAQFDSNFPRPDFTQATNNFCQAISCFVRSMENVNQYLFDNFIPFPFLNWREFLCMYDSLICILLRAVNNILNIFFNIDKIINYPNDQYYAQVVKPQVIWWINSVAPPRYKSPINDLSMYPVIYTSWLWPTNSSLIPGTQLANPMYQQKRLTDCLCIYFNRLICDPADPSTPCYSSTAVTILGPFSPCCLLVEALTTIVDVIAVGFDLTLHFYNFDATTIFVNNQYVTTAVALDLTALVRCILNAFAIIPTVGPCIAEFLAGVVGYVFGVVDFLLRVVNGLILLPYYLVANIQNFITNRGQAITFLLTLTNQFTNATLANSSINCACFILNFGIQFPPIPCTSCVPGGFIPLPPSGGGGSGGREIDPDQFPLTAGLLESLKNGNSAAAADTPVLKEGENILDYIANKRDDMRIRVEKIIQGDFRNWHREENAKSFFVPQNGSYTLTPTQPPTALTCTNPVPACFDLCCAVRTGAAFFYSVVFFLSQTINSLAQDWDIGFPYFVNGNVSICSAQCPTQQANAPNCAAPCPGIKISFEDALAQMIIQFTQNVVCLCEVVNQVIPITGFPSVYTERPDICCWVVRVGDLIAANLLLIVRMIKNLATGNVNSVPGGPPFPYFTEGQFIGDVDQIFLIMLDVVICLGYMVRAIFPVQTVADIDVYCPIQNLSFAAIYFTSWIVNIIISLGTIQYPIGQNYFIDPNCNWSASGCVPQVTGLQFYKDGVLAIDAFFGTRGGACSDNFVGGGCTTTHGTDQGIGGLTQCICQVVTTLFPIRPNPLAPTGPPNNCPTVDVCCPVRQLMFFADGSTKFILQGLTTLWQRWDGAYPSSFMAFWFCDETASPIPQGCGIINPVIESLTEIFSLCICQVFSMLDAFLANFFPGFRCFCGAGFPPGIFCSVGSLVNIILVQVTTLLRRANDINYWQPAGYPAPDLSETWTIRFFGPVQEVLCDFVGSNVCFFTTLVPFCPNWMSRLFQSAFIWLFVAVERVSLFLEGFITTFTNAPCGSAYTTSVYGINTACLTGAITSLVSFFFDATMADGMISCRVDPCVCNNGIYPVNYTYSNAISSNVIGQNGRLPTPCVFRNQYIDQPWWFQTCCDGTAATFILPNGVVKQCLAYNASVPATTPECLPLCYPTQPQPCRYISPALPMCNSIIGELPMDGGFMAIFRVLRCLFQLAFGGGVLFDGLITLDSVLWQLSKPIVNVLVSGVMLILELFINPGGPLDFLGKVVGFFTSFSSIFSAPIILPSNIDPFARRDSNSSSNENNHSRRYHSDIWAVLNLIFMEYNTDDCNTDFLTCFNRNFMLSCDTMECALAVLKTKFIGNATCDDLINSDAILSTVQADRLMYIDCVDKRIMGERIQRFLFPNFPPQFMYVGWRYIPSLLWEVNEMYRPSREIQFKEQESRFQNIQEQLREREHRIMAMKRFSPGMAQIVVKLDAIEWKIRGGYYSYLLQRLARHGVQRRSNEFESGASLYDTVRITGHGAWEAGTILYHGIPNVATAMARSTAAAVEMLTTTEGWNRVSGHFAEFYKEWYHKVFVHEDPEDRARREHLRSLVKQGPIYQWFTRVEEEEGKGWDGPSWPLTSYVRHAFNVMQFRRNSTEPGFWNGYGVRNHWDRVKEHINDRFLTPHWTPLQVYNLNRFKRVALKIFDTLYPGHLTRELYERFIFDQGCAIVNDSVNLIVSVYSYCANLQSNNVNATIRKVDHIVHSHVFGEKTSEYLIRMVNFTDTLSERLRVIDPKTRSSCGFNQQNGVPTWLIPDIVMERQRNVIVDNTTGILKRLFTFNIDEASRDLFPYNMTLSLWHGVKGTVAERFAWVRPRNLMESPPIPDHLNISLVGMKSWRRAVLTPRTSTGGANWNLLDWLLDFVDWITGWELAQQLAQFFNNFQSLFINPNYKCRDYPNVGIRYYLQGPLECDFPCNVDCRNGMGLEAALGQVLKYWGLAVLLSFFLFQSGLTFVFSNITLLVIFALVTPWLAWGYSVRCAFLTPAISLVGFEVWWWPFPFASIYPFCAVDDILALLDKYITNCYSFIWPSCMFHSSNVCPTCPARFDMVNCLNDVNMGDGISNALWLGYQVGGSNFCNIVQSFGNSIVAIFIPWAPEYLQGQCSQFMSSNPTTQCRLSTCFWMTLPSLVLPLILGSVFFTFFGFVLPAIFDLLVALWYVIITSPIALIWGSSTAGFDPQGGPGDEDIDDDDDDDDKKNEKEEEDDEQRPISLTKAQLRVIVQSELKRRPPKKKTIIAPKSSLLILTEAIGSAIFTKAAPVKKLKKE